MPTPRLSIVIPHSDPSEAELLESTLVSVLQNRPRDCEVLLAHTGIYDDPYDLSDELEFVEARRQAGTLELLNESLDYCTGDVIHMLFPGVEVCEGWTQTALDAVLQHSVAAAAPVIVDADAPDVILSVGVTASSVRRRKELGRGMLMRKAKFNRFRPLSPTTIAGFYRRDVLEAVRGFNTRAGDRFADFDLGLTLEKLGLSTVLLSDCVVRSCRPTRSGIVSFQIGRAEERAASKHDRSFVTATLRKSATVALDFCRSFRRPAIVLSALGRMSSWLEFGSRRRYQVQLEAWRKQIQSHSDAIDCIPIHSIESHDDAAADEISRAA